MKVFLAAITVLLISIGAESKADAQVFYPSTESSPLMLPGAKVPALNPEVLTPYPVSQPLIQAPQDQLNSQQEIWLQNQQFRQQQINQNLLLQNQQQLREVEQQQQFMLRHR